MQRIILEYLQQHGESEFYDIYNFILNHEKDFTVSNLRSIVAQACNALISQGKILLTSCFMTAEYKYKCYYKSI